MMRKRNLKRELEKFLSDENIDRLLDRLVFELDAEGVAAALRQKVHEEEKSLYKVMEQSGGVDRQALEGYFSTLDHALDELPAKIRSHIVNDTMKVHLYNYIVALIRNSKTVYDGPAMKSWVDSLVKAEKEAIADACMDDWASLWEEYFDPLCSTDFEERLWPFHSDLTEYAVAALQDAALHFNALLEQIVKVKLQEVIDFIDALERINSDLVAFLTDVPVERAEQLFGIEKINQFDYDVRFLSDMVDQMMPYKVVRESKSIAC